tara:strand:- start:1 stop:243 length:243 start_codon:yes stop_codon:yes gene_type:complete
LSDLKRKYAGAPNQIARDIKRMRYVENPNSGVAKAKIIEIEVEINLFLSKIHKSSEVLKNINFSCIKCNSYALSDAGRAP